MSRLELVPILADHAIKIAEKHGSDKHFQGLSGQVRFFSSSLVELVYRTPKAMAHGEDNFGIDSWYEKKKVFSVVWNSSQYKDYKLIRLRRGPWETEILSGQLDCEITCNKPDSAC